MIAIDIGTALELLAGAVELRGRGCPWGEVLDRARAGAVKFLDVLPDSALDVMAPAR